MASSSNSDSQDMYDIFLSFRGLDTRTKFTDRLYEALKQKGYHTFRDRERIETGENINTELRKAIEKSRISIIVFSENYTKSKACMFEIKAIIEHREAKPDHSIVPVYYEVDPFEIKKQAKNLENLAEVNMGEEVEFEGKKVKVKELKEWSTALMKVTHLGGVVSGDLSKRYENEFIEEIIAVIESKKTGYYLYLDKNMKNLKRKVEYLEARENDIKSQISSSECRRLWKRPKKEVEVWLADIQRFKDDVQRLDEEVAGQRNGCNVVLGVQLGKRIKEKVQEVAEFQEKGKAFNGLLVDDFPTDKLLMPPTNDLVESTEARNVERVWECLMDDGIRKIGVYGMGGIGKTTIMKLIHNKLLKETDKFDAVYWVTVSKSFNVIKLQSDIAKELGFGLSDDEDETRRAKQLFTALSHQEKYVLIIDDLWEDFPLDRVGIPEQMRPNGCKLVLITRSLEVCRKMGCTLVEVNLLTEEEAQTLFLTKAVGHDLAPDVKTIAYQVSKECAHLPLAIVTVAGSLRGLKEIHDWRNALNELIHITRDTCGVSKVFEQLKFSYDRLGDKVLQDCFLYCALYPKDQEIQVYEVIEYWIAEGLIGERESEEAKFDEGHAILRKLTSSCLLESCMDVGESAFFSVQKGDREGKCVRMHDLIRDMALRITARSPRFMAKAGEGLKSIPCDVWSEDLDWFSLMHNRIIELPNISPVCHRLTTLILKENSFRMIPDSFFTNMPNLKVLDLSRTPITSLPKSISNLERLHTILLDGCPELEDVPSLEKLKALKVFKLTYSKIQKFPEGIEELVDLRKLDLSKNRSLWRLPRSRLSKLLKLQYLDLTETRAIVLAEDLLCLTQLEVVAIRFHKLPELTRYMKSPQVQRLKTYGLRFGANDQWPLDGRTVFIGFVPSETRVDRLGLPSNMSVLRFHTFHAFNSLSSIPCLKDAKDLRICVIEYCNRLESIFSASTFPENGQISLGNLEELNLRYLPRFRVLFDGIVSRHGIYFNLKKLKMFECNAVKTIIHVPLLQNIPNLEELEVWSCLNVENVIVETEEISDSGNRQDSSSAISLLKLKRLWLMHLPSLKSIYNGVMMCPSIEFVLVLNCLMLTRLPLSLHKDGDQATPPPALKQIEAEIGWWDALEWDDPHTKTILQPYLCEWRYVDDSDDKIVYRDAEIEDSDAEIEDFDTEVNEIEDSHLIDLNKLPADAEIEDSDAEIEDPDAEMEDMEDSDAEMEDPVAEMEVADPERWRTLMQRMRKPMERSRKLNLRIPFLIYVNKSPEEI